MDRLPLARADITVDPPPAVAHRTTGAAARLIPIVMALASLGMLGVVVASGSVGARNPMLMMFPVMMVVSAVAAIVTGGAGRHRAELDADRRRYLRYLTALSVRLGEDAVALRDWLVQRHPEPETLWTVVGSAEMWMRHRDEPDFGAARIGVGTVPATTRLIGPDRGSCGERDPVTTSALNRLLREYEGVAEAPITATMGPAATVTVTGDGSRARALVRAVICQLAVAHSPADIGIAVLAGGGECAHWEWLKWLPHQREFPDSTARRRILVLDGPDGPIGPAPDAATTVMRICEAGAGPGLRIDTGTGEIILTRPDQLSPIMALTVARRLAGYQPALERAGGTEHWLRLVGVADAAQIDPNTLWDKEYQDTLRVPIGISTDGAAVELDIREAAAGGMGPHGLCVGATGSGKSELLRTIALGMIARHSPETLNLILVDFKGGATFLDLARTRHTTAVITNLEDEAHLVERMGEALGGEIDRRQRILRAAGNFSGIADYHRARREGRSLAPLPALFIIVDEFAELLSRHPEFVDVFVAIGRLGRSLGMHLLLASQRLDEGRLRGLDSHLSYRICLKTLSDSESRTVIGISDAYLLPGRPGAGYLKVVAGQPVGFQATYVSGPLGGPRGAARPKPATPRVFIADSRGDDAGPPGRDDAGPRVTVLQTVVDALAGYGPPPHRVWLPPLDESAGLDTLLAGAGRGELRVPIGLVDRAFEHRRDPLVLDLSGAAGNVAIIGAPRTGKTTAVRTFVSALAATHDPRAVQIYCLDFGGGGLADLAVLPHVGTVAPRSNPDLVRRTVAEIVVVLRRREALGAGIDDPYGELFLVVDGWTAARREHDDLDATLTEIAGSGLAHGIHVVLTGSRWADVRPGLRDQIATRLELRLGDPADSEIDRGRAARVPRDRPGHGLSTDGLPMVLALPGSEFRTSDDGWQAPAVRLLPDRLDYPGLAAEAAGAGCVLGIDEDRLMPVALDFNEQHLLVFGEPGCGKTAVLRLLCHEITRTVPDVWLITVDPRRTLPEFGGDGLPVVLETLRERVAGGGGDGGEVRQIFVVVDDYDLATSALAPLTEMLPQARDIGLHLVVARRSGGAGRALYDPVLCGLREAGSMGLQLSGCPDDGPLVGAVRPKPLPPGRGVLVTRAGGERTIQVAWVEPA